MEDRQLSTHFKLSHLTVSQWAARAGVSNAPTDTRVLGNLQYLAERLEVVADVLGHRPVITSGYRSPEVNRAVGGMSSSYHCLGLAADIICPEFGTPVEVARKLMGSTVLFDQLIHEYGRWCHVGVEVPGAKPRLQALSLFRPGRYLPGILDKEL